MLRRPFGSHLGTIDYDTPPGHTGTAAAEGRSLLRSRWWATPTCRSMNRPPVPLPENPSRDSPCFRIFYTNSYSQFAVVWYPIIFNTIRRRPPSSLKLLLVLLVWYNTLWINFCLRLYEWVAQLGSTTKSNILVDWLVICWTWALLFMVAHVSTWHADQVLSDIFVSQKIKRMIIARPLRVGLIILYAVHLQNFNTTRITLIIAHS